MGPFDDRDVAADDDDVAHYGAGQRQIAVEDGDVPGDDARDLGIAVKDRHAAAHRAPFLDEQILLKKGQIAQGGFPFADDIVVVITGDGDPRGEQEYEQQEE